MSYGEWLCISEDHYVSETFFDIISQESQKEIKVRYLGQNTSFTNNLEPLFAKKFAEISYIQNIKDDILDDNPEISDDDLNKKVFTEYIDLYRPVFYFFFDLDRFQEAFYNNNGYLERQDKIEKIKKFAKEVNEIEGISFYIVPSFPAIATCAYYFEAYRLKRDINVEVSTHYQRDCQNLCDRSYNNPTQRFIKEECVQCLMKNMNTRSRGYGYGEKKYFHTEIQYPYLSIIKDKTNFDAFYQYIYPYVYEGDEFCLMENLNFEESIIDKLANRTNWYSAIPLFINKAYNA